MADTLAFYAANGFWMWLVLAALLLAVEIPTGSGWLLWPSAAAALVGGIVLVVKLPPLTAVLIFAAVTVVSTLTSRRYLRGQADEGGDINDNIGRLVGRRGETVSAFSRGAGRVFIDGKEWAAELDGADELAAGARVEVTGVHGAHLRVRAL